MNLKLIVAILVITAVPVCAQTQPPSAAKVVTRADVQKVARIIRGDKAKTQIYCDIGKLGGQIEEANEKKDSKTANELSQKMKELEKKLGPEYVALMEGLQDIDPESDEGTEIEAALVVLDKLCAK
jgi:peptidoglycan hydrolase CwlO-like protein